MHAIVSLLDEKHNACVADLWQELRVDCGLSGVLLTPLPHFSLHVAREYDFLKLEPVLVELAAKAKLRSVWTSGVGLFTGPSPVIYLVLVKDVVLVEFHRAVWELVRPYSIEPSLHYAPDAWVPHITLAHGDVTPDKLSCALQRLVYRPLKWEIPIDSLAIVCQDEGQVGRLQNKYLFGGI